MSSDSFRSNIGTPIEDVHNSIPATNTPNIPKVSGFFWNVRGLNKSSKHPVIKKWIEEQQFQFGCLLETRVKEENVSRLCTKIFRDWSVLTNYEYNRRGRIWVIWRSTARLSPFFKSEQLITCSVKLENHTEEFFCSFVYALNTGEQRKVLWQELRDHFDSSIIRSKPWIILGDFNETLDMDEHSRVDDNPVVTSGMRDFQETVVYCSITDMTAHGPLFTWWNKQEINPIMKKLDRVLVNDVWMQAFPQSYSVFEAGGCSDHLHCRISLNDEGGSSINKRKPFKFVNVLAEMEEFMPLVGDYWKETEPLFLSTSSLFRFTKKLKGLKPLLRTLTKEKISPLVKKSKEAYDDLCKKQETHLANPSIEAMEEENEAFLRWDHVAGLEEKFLKQLSKLHWLEVGDKNNKTFHRAAVLREAKNTIKEIVCNDGRVVKGEEIKTEAERFFKEFLQLVPTDFEGLSVEELGELLPFRCSVLDQQLLTRVVTAEEIKKVLFAMPNDKSPGPDGFTSEFFKETWDIIGSEFTIAIQSFFAKGFLPKGINSTILALIPKKTEAKEMKDYRPISCCNVIYKVISKVIANRLKLLLPKFIAGNQSAFVQDRLLIENVLLATELVKDYHRETVTERCAIKIDISKAFDSVQWSFLINTLMAMHFPATFIHWIRLCISTASFSVQVNGELAGYFQSSRGLRQGCALSPYLFVICMDVLSKLLDRAAGTGHVGYHPRCKSLGLTHLSFADDLMVLCDGKIRSIEGIIEVFNRFSTYSGLKISMEKSTMYVAGISSTARDIISTRFPFEVGEFPVRYLGLPLVTKRLTAEDYAPLLEQIRKRIGSWTSRYLSFAGRFNLISSVIWSTCNFWLGAFLLPRDCIKEIEKLCSAYLWSGTDMNTKKAKMSWEQVCKPKTEGGLGLRSLKEANDVGCLKLVWRIISHGDSLWIKWLEKNLLKRELFWTVKENANLGSWIWKKILKYREVAKQFSKVEVGNGESTSFWFDNWSSLGRLVDVAGARGVIDLGISRKMSVAEAWRSRRRRRHRHGPLNSIEEVLSNQRLNRTEENDKVLWRGKNDMYTGRFSTKDTWNHTRTTSNVVAWHRGVWFPHATPKFSFCLWLAVHDRLATGDRMLKWNSGASGDCVLCSHCIESRNHLFFACDYASEVWAALGKGVLKTHYSNDWSQILSYVSDHRQSRVDSFLLRYTFQATVYSIWRERNGRRHGQASRTAAQLIIWIDSQVKNQISMIRRIKDRRYEACFQAWLQSRS